MVIGNSTKSTTNAKGRRLAPESQSNILQKTGIFRSTPLKSSKFSQKPLSPPQGAGSKRLFLWESSLHWGRRAAIVPSNPSGLTVGFRRFQLIGTRRLGCYSCRGHDRIGIL